MPDLVFLPATAPGDATYGDAPRRIDAPGGWRCRHVRFDRVVWYNAEIRRQAAEQIDAMGLASCVLVGFSKSGLGAIHLARELATPVAATIVFDAPVSRRQVPPWGLEEFYRDDDEWQEDLPMANAESLARDLPAGHRLILISGSGFHDEMVAFSRRLEELSLPHVFLPRPNMKHHWDAGWLEEGLAALASGR